MEGVDRSSTGSNWLRQFERANEEDSWGQVDEAQTNYRRCAASSSALIDLTSARLLDWRLRGFAYCRSCLARGGVSQMHAAHASQGHDEEGLL